MEEIEAIGYLLLTLRLFVDFRDHGVFLCSHFLVARFVSSLDFFERVTLMTHRVTSGACH